MEVSSVAEATFHYTWFAATELERTVYIRWLNSIQITLLDYPIQMVTIRSFDFVCLGVSLASDEIYRLVVFHRSTVLHNLFRLVLLNG